MFERQNTNFEDHIGIQHCLWDYVYFLIYIINKPDYDYKGIEYYLSEHYNQKMPNWFPIGATRYLKGSVEEEDNGLESLVEKNNAAVMSRMDVLEENQKLLMSWVKTLVKPEVLAEKKKDSDENEEEEDDNEDDDDYSDY